ncbi:type II secretion system F family protein [Thalassotalea agarivorans]|uniref:MSHA biogenesis protein MshG n=1 Tax=Thalassotalea agarivorans TaxID=349064 RepID=A0A1I0G0E4_THASX|nr:type II secretion system F family protein [Thalassotalea agarivorans]SET64131.1 MSHA biogenesis protein MshG [Thalassotalea agarivorans]
MPVFNYKGRTVKGESVEGLLEAKDAEAVAAQLMRQNVTPVSIEASLKTEKSKGLLSKDLKNLLGMNTVSVEELILFCRQMYALTKSGVPILRAIRGMSESSSSEVLKEALDDIAGQLEGGYALSAALNSYPNIFSPLFVSLIHVGENTGQLDSAFLKLSTYFVREHETKKRIKQAMRYPLLVIGFIGVALVILNIFVIPKFMQLFSTLGADLPLPTKFLIASSSLFVNYWPHMLVTILVIYFAIRHYLKTEKGRYSWDQKKIKMPIIGSIVERSILARFSHSFAIVLRAGVPMTSGLSLVADAVDNTYMKAKIVGMRAAIEGGESLLRVAISSTLFTPLVLQMISVGEETGRVDELLEEVGEYYEREVDYDLSTLTAKIEPILIVVVAAMVLVLALGVFLPMWDMASAFQGKK